MNSFTVKPNWNQNQEKYDGTILKFQKKQTIVKKADVQVLNWNADLAKSDLWGKAPLP